MFNNISINNLYFINLESFFFLKMFLHHAASEKARILWCRRQQWEFKRLQNRWKIFLRDWILKERRLTFPLCIDPLKLAVSTSYVSIKRSFRISYWYSYLEYHLEESYTCTSRSSWEENRDSINIYLEVIDCPWSILHRYKLSRNYTNA